MTQLQQWWDTARILAPFADGSPLTLEILVVLEFCDVLFSIGQGRDIPDSPAT